VRDRGLEHVQINHNPWTVSDITTHHCDITTCHCDVTRVSASTVLTTIDSSVEYCGIIYNGCGLISIIGSR